MSGTDYISIKEFAEIVGVSVEAVREWIEDGTIQTTQFAKKGKHFINKLDIPTFMRKEQK